MVIETQQGDSERSVQFLVGAILVIAWMRFLIALNEGEYKIRPYRICRILSESGQSPVTR